jgi:heme o synthase
VLRAKIADVLPAPYLLCRMQEKVGSYFLLIKPRIVLLVMLTGLTALVIEGSLLNYPARFAGVLLGIFLAAGSANALNQAWDRDIDAIMARTRNKRPLPAGKVSLHGALYFSAVSGAASIWLLNMAGNALAAILGMGAIAFYVCVYTMWLKRRTSLNIVIGGAAGAVAPLIGWAAGAGELNTVPLLMFLVIFLWTPPHFWALALWKQEEFARAAIPMLPIVAGEKSTRMQITAHVAILLPVTAYLGIHAGFGWIFLGGSTLMGANLIRKVRHLQRRKDNASAQALFSYSIVYLAAIFTLMLASKW